MNPRYSVGATKYRGSTICQILGPWLHPPRPKSLHINDLTSVRRLAVCLCTQFALCLSAQRQNRDIARRI